MPNALGLVPGLQLHPRHLLPKVRLLKTADGGLRRMRQTLLTAIGLLAMTTASLAIADGNSDAGQEKAYTCMGCHGAPGLRNAYPAYRVPKLGGQHAAYIVTALKAYRNKDRSHPTMQAQASTLSDDDMVNIAAYFATLGNKQ